MTPAQTAVRNILGPMTSEARCREVVLAVLEAVRKPSEAMQNAGREHAQVSGLWQEDGGYPSAFFTGAIDALISEERR